MAGGCSKHAQTDSSAERNVDARHWLDAGETPIEESKVEVHLAARCAECHGELYEQWKESRHARASTSDAYVRLRKAAGDDACARCHEPLAKLIEKDDPVSRDGVSCEVCHTTTAVEVKDEAATFRLRPEERTKFGPLCDAVDHYFHKMGCSPLHGESQFCAGCHHWSLPLADGTKVRVLGEYDEWRESAYAKKGVSCQDCHMPWRVAPLAAGSAARVNASHHGFRGENSDLRKHALSAKMTVARAGDRLRLAVAVKNEGAGHFVPTGIPDHRVLLEVVSVDVSGRELDRAERTYGKELVDGQGRATSFSSAAKQASDTRLGPEEERKEEMELTGSGATAVKLRLVFIDVAPNIARSLDYEPQREIMFEETRALQGAKGRATPSREVHR